MRGAPWKKSAAWFSMSDAETPGGDGKNCRPDLKDKRSQANCLGHPVEFFRQPHILSPITRIAKVGAVSAAAGRLARVVMMTF